MSETDHPPIIPPQKPSVPEGGFNPVIPPVVSDLNGGEHNITSIDPHQIGVSEQLTADMEDALLLKPGELTSNDPTDPNYKPAYTRTEKWAKFKETGEV